MCKLSPHGTCSRASIGGHVTRLRVNPEVAIRALPDGDAVVARSDGTEAVIVNATAHAILELLADEGSEADIAKTFVRTFPNESVDAMQRDVHALIARLVQDGILEPCGSESSTV